LAAFSRCHNCKESNMRTVEDVLGRTPAGERTIADVLEDISILLAELVRRNNEGVAK
jgi:hypothetical protein